MSISSEYHSKCMLYTLSFCIMHKCQYSVSRVRPKCQINCITWDYVVDLQRFPLQLLVAIELYIQEFLSFDTQRGNTPGTESKVQNCALWNDISPCRHPTKSAIFETFRDSTFFVHAISSYMRYLSYGSMWNIVCV